MGCLYCKGILVRMTVPYTIHRMGYHFVLDAAPAWVCDQCGEFMFDEDDVESIQQVVTQLDQVVALTEAA